MKSAQSSPSSVTSAGTVSPFSMARWLRALMAPGTLLLGISLATPSASAEEIREYGPMPTPLSGVCEVEHDRNGFVWIEQYLASSIARLNPVTGEIVEFPLPKPFSVPGGFELGWDGGIWFTEFTSNSVVRLDPENGSYQYFPFPWPDALGKHPGPYGIWQSEDMTKGADGAMWFNLPGLNAVGRIDIDTKEMTKYQIPTADIPTQPGMGVDGALNIITHGPNNTILFNEPDTNKIGTINVFTKEFREYTIPTPGAVPIGVAEGPDGAIWFTESMAHKFGRIDPVTGEVTEFDILKLRPLPLTIGLGNPYPFPGAMKLGGDGNLYFSEIQGGNPNLSNLIARYNPRTGEFKEIAVPTPFSSPGCDLNNQDPDAIWFGEISANQVGRLSIGPRDPKATRMVKKWDGF